MTDRTTQKDPPEAFRNEENVNLKRNVPRSSPEHNRTVSSDPPVSSSDPSGYHSGYDSDYDSDYDSGYGASSSEESSNDSNLNISEKKVKVQKDKTLLFRSRHRNSEAKSYRAKPKKAAKKKEVITASKKPDNGLASFGLRLSEEFPVPSKGEATPEFFEENYIDKLPKREAFVEGLSAHLLAIGLIGEAEVKITSEVAYREHMKGICRRAWSHIPSHSDEKKIREARGESWVANDHYNAFWRMWSEIGLLYRDYLSSYDPAIVRRISSWCHDHRVSKQDREKYLPPKKSARTRLEAKEAKFLTGRSAANAEHNRARYNAS